MCIYACLCLVESEIPPKLNVCFAVILYLTIVHLYDIVWKVLQYFHTLKTCLTNQNTHILIHEHTRTHANTITTKQTFSSVNLGFKIESNNLTVKQHSHAMQINYQLSKLYGDHDPFGSYCYCYCSRFDSVEGISNVTHR